MLPFVRLRSLMRPIVPATATTVLLGLTAIEVNAPASKRASNVSYVFLNIPSAVILHITAPVWGDQLIKLPSSEQVTMFLPDGENEPPKQGPVCPEKICIGVPWGIFHIQTVPSFDPPKITGPEGCQFSHYSQPFQASTPKSHLPRPLQRQIPCPVHSRYVLVRPYRL
jgi:hypothetical protein